MQGGPPFRIKMMWFYEIDDEMTQRTKYKLDLKRHDYLSVVKCTNQQTVCYNFVLAALYVT